MRCLLLLIFFWINLSYVYSKVFRSHTADEIEVNDFSDISTEDDDDGYPDEQEIQMNDENEQYYGNHDSDSYQRDKRFYDKEEETKEAKEAGSSDDVIDNDLSTLDILLESANLQTFEHHKTDDVQYSKTTAKDDGFNRDIDSSGNGYMADKSITVAQMKVSLKRSGVTQTKLDNFLVSRFPICTIFL